MSDFAEHTIAFPNESREYREARDALFQREVNLQREMRLRLGRTRATALTRW